jgi:VanZ family protein
MSNSRRGLRFWLGAWWPVALGVCVILLESTEMFGSDHTSGPLHDLYEVLFGPISWERWDRIHHFIRKSGHFLGYGAIGLAWLRAWWMSLPHSRFVQDALMALAGTAMVASLDEWHQTFLPNRTGSPYDVLLDCCGALTLQLIVYMCLRIARPKKLVRAA